MSEYGSYVIFGGKDRTGTARSAPGNRILSGRLRDPRVGRDILVGAVAGTALALTMLLHTFVPEWTGSPPHYPFGVNADSLLGVRYLPSQLVSGWMIGPVFTGMTMVAGLLLLRIVLRIQWLAVAVLFAILTFTAGIDFDHLWVDLTLAVVRNALTLFVLLRFGLFALMALEFFNLVASSVDTLDPSQLYSAGSYFALIVGVAAVAYGFYIALAGRSIFKDTLFQD